MYVAHMHKYIYIYIFIYFFIERDVWCVRETERVRKRQTDRQRGRRHQSTGTAKRNENEFFIGHREYTCIY